MSDFVTVEVAAEVLHVSGKTVRNLIERGRFPGAYRIDPHNSHSTWRIPRQDLTNYQQQQTTANDQPARA